MKTLFYFLLTATATFFISCSKKEDIKPEPVVPPVDTAYNILTDTTSVKVDTNIIDTLIWQQNYRIVPLTGTVYTGRIYFYNLVGENGFILPFSNLYYAANQPYGLLVHIYKGTIKLKYKTIDGLGNVKNFNVKTYYLSQTKIKKIEISYDLLGELYKDTYLPIK